jgi:hypothetical protein
VWFSVDPAGDYTTSVSDRGSPVSGAVRQAAHNAWWPYRLPALTGHHRRRRDTEFAAVLWNYNLAMVGADWYGVPSSAVETRYDLEAWLMEHRIPGICMLVAGELGLRFDEQFRWRYAGDDFE